MLARRFYYDLFRCMVVQQEAVGIKKGRHTFLLSPFRLGLVNTDTYGDFHNLHLHLK